MCEAGDHGKDEGLTILEILQTIQEILDDLDKKSDHNLDKKMNDLEKLFNELVEDNDFTLTAEVEDE